MSIVAVMLLVGAGMVVYNADSLILAGQRSLTSQLPDVLEPNATNTIMLLTTDANGRSLANEAYSIEVVVNNTTIARTSGRTDASGFAAKGIFVPNFNGTASLRVSAAGEVLSRDVKAVADSRVYLTTDKPIYMPGQTVHSRVLVLRQELWAVPSGQGGQGGAAGANVTFEVKTPDGDRVFRKTSALNEYGVVAFDYPLSDQLPLGLYELRVKVAGQELVKNVKVDEYVLPRFEINFNELKSWYTYNETVDAYATVRYFYGEKVKGSAALTINAYTGSGWVPVTTGSASKPLADGNFEFTYGLPALSSSSVRENFPQFSLPESMLLEFNLSVTDTGDHTEYDSQVVTVAAHPILVSALTDVNVAGRDSTYYIVARFPDGSPVGNGTVKWSIIDKTSDGDKTRAMASVATDARGIAVLPFEYKDSYTGMGVTVTKNGYDGTASLDLKASSGLKVVSDKRTYRVGDVAVFDVFYAGAQASDLLFYDVVADGFTVATGHVSMPGDRATLDLPVTSDFGKLTSVRFFKIERNFGIARDIAVIGVDKTGGELDINITSDKTTYLPQDPVSLRIKVTRNGEGVAAMLGVSIVDNAVFELGARSVGFDDVLQGMLPQYVDPLTQFLGYVFADEPTLPSESLSQWSTKDTAAVESTGAARADAAKDFEAKAVGTYWTIVAGMVVVGVVAVLAMGPRTRHWKAILIVTMLIVAPILAVVGSYLSERNQTTSEQALPEGQGWRGEGAAPPAAPAKAGDGGIIDWSDLNGMGAGRGNGSEGQSGYTIPTKPSIVRQFFPETWAWLPVLPTDASGTVTLDLTAPDSITSWDVSVIASTMSALVGVAHKNVTVFQRFFVEPDMPAKAYLGDRFPLKVQVYNYGAADDIQVRLDTADWFTVNGSRTATLSLGSGEVGSVNFTVELTKVGIHDLRVSGESSTFTDNVVRPMRVKPAGERITDMFQGRLSGGNVTAHNLTLLAQLIADSQSGWVKLQGGVEAAVIEGADGFIHYVSGCGEQSLSTLSIDVLAFRTVREGGLAEAKLLELEDIVNQGIAHELQYLLPANNGQGRGIVWFPGDQDVHPWLTAWGVITMRDATLAGFDIDPKIITDMQKWLRSTQNENGSFTFPEWGIYEFNNPKLRSKTLATTAYVAHALIYSGVSTSDEAVQKAVGYVRANVESDANWADPYVLALALKLLADTGDAGGSLAGRIADKLHELRTEDNGTTSWGSSTNMISNEVFGKMAMRDMWNENPGFVIETTGYAAQALYASNRYLGDVEGAVKFLLDHRSEFGTWYSTQDTVVAFQTIYKVSERSVDTDMTVVIKVDGTQRWSEHIDATNHDLTFLYDLRPYLSANTTEVSLEATGTGFVMFQVFLEQWVPWGAVTKEEPLELNLTYDRTNVSVGESVTATARVTNHQDRSVKMALVELTAPVGMRFDKFQFDDLLARRVVDNVEYGDGLVRLYINDLQAGKDVKFTYTLTAESPAQVTLGGCRVFDMYNALVEMELPPIGIGIAVGAGEG